MSSHDYPDFIDSTGYGTGEGLCGYNSKETADIASSRIIQTYQSQ